MNVDVSLLSTALEFMISVALAFLIFAVQNMRSDTKISLKVGQDNRVDIGRILSTLESLVDRLDRLEDQWDNEDTRSRDF